jgi:hypothetical protein
VSAEFLVILVLAAVAVFAVRHRPRGFYGEWVTLSQRFATERRPEKFSHLAQKLFFSPIMPWWIAWSRLFSGEYCSFDVELNQEGMWLHYQGPEPRKCADFLFIPWSEVVNAARVGDLVRLKLDTRRDISIDMPPELGAAALRAIG